MDTKLGRIVITSVSLLTVCFGAVIAYESGRDSTDEEKAQAVWGSPEWEELSAGVYKFPAKRSKWDKRLRVAESENFQVIFQRFLASHAQLEVVSMVPVVGQFGNEVITEYIIVVTRPKPKT
jgi:hypothetical protein